MDVRLRNNGSALISALFVMTLVAIVATAMSTRLQQDIYLTQLSLNRDKLYLASQAVSFWAMDILSNKETTLNQLDKKGRINSFPAKLGEPYPEIVTQGELYDLQARFNLNNLQDQKFQIMFKNLLANILSLDEGQQQSIVEATKQWMQQKNQSALDPNRKTTLYRLHNLAHRSMSSPFQDISEFRTLAGIDADIYQRLLGIISVLPEITPINIKTASRSVLSILGDGLNDAEVSELIKLRKAQQTAEPNPQQTELLQRLNINPASVTEESSYFLATATVKSQSMTLTVYSVLLRSKPRNKEEDPSVWIIHQSFSPL